MGYLLGSLLHLCVLAAEKSIGVANVYINNIGTRVSVEGKYKEGMGDAAVTYMVWL